MYHESYLGRLETIRREWGGLAYGPARDAASASAACTGTPGDVSEWMDAIVESVRELGGVPATRETFTFLEIGAAGLSVTPRLRAEFPKSWSYVTCPSASSCTVHRFDDDPRVRVYEIEPRQIFATKPGEPRSRRSRQFDAVVFLDPAVLSPAERSFGTGHYLPELAARWLNTYASLYFVAVHESTSPFADTDAVRVHQLAAGAGDVVLVCGERSADAAPAPRPGTESDA